MMMENKEKLNYCCSSRAVVDRLISIGTAKEKLLQLLDADYFDELSKHHEYWNRESDDDDRLDECRMRFKHISETLWDIVGVLSGDNEND